MLFQHVLNNNVHQWKNILINERDLSFHKYFFTLIPCADGITAYDFRLIFINPFIKERSLKEKKRRCLTVNLRGYHGGSESPV